jgi:hypothetical protein
MKNQLLKLRKAEGYIGVETMIIAALVIAAGFIALKTVMEDLNEKAAGFNNFLDNREYYDFEVN